MSGELRPSTPARRPEGARPREDVEPVVEPPSADELVRIERHLCLLATESGARASERDDLRALVVTHPDGGPAANFVAMPRWTPVTWRESLDAAADLLRAGGAWPSLLLADRLDRPIGLTDALATTGWRLVHEEEVHWVGRASVVPHLDPSLRIEAVQARGVGDHEALERAIFAFAESAAEARRRWLAEAIADGRMRAYVVRLDDEPVAVARLSQGVGVAGLYGIGVAEGRRGQGLGTLITTVATRAGLALGNRVVWLSVEPGNAAAMRLYRRLGFARAFGWGRWMRLEG